jgi:tRNA pseudouridine32 synthase / 23S rRNA pseudouridine746 synthase
MSPPPPPPPPLHQDDSLVVLDKPAGLLAVPGRGADKQDCLLARAMPHWPGLCVVHRLDMATSGLIVFARGPLPQRQLSAAFERRRVHKSYEAVVRGLVRDEHGEVDLPLAADWPNRPRQRVDHTAGKPSQTRWRVVARDEARGRTRLALEPVTGRSHQLRVHLLALGHPILGDALYAPADAAAASPRLLLHATGLAFEHPATGAACAFRSGAPF